MQFFDSHCHFDFSEFDGDRDNIWRDCQARGVRQLMIPGVSLSSFTAAAAIAGQYEGIYTAAGLHPWWVEKDLGAADVVLNPSSIHDRLLARLVNPKCVAVGECGLDAVINTSLPLQQQVLDIHLQVASETGLPLIIHCRKAHNELVVQLKTRKLSAGGVIHAFSGSYELATAYWEMGFRLGIGGTITYERANKTRQAVKKLPLEALLLETDAPDMPLYGRQGEPNSPVNIPAIAQVLADLREEPVAIIAAHTTRNARQLFKISD